MTRIKAHSLTGRINLQSLGETFESVRRNRGAAGIDRVSIALYEGQLLQNLVALHRRLKDGIYQSLPPRRVHIPKANTGETRPLGIPAVADRVAQEMVRRLLNPLFEGVFHAVRRVLQLQRQGFQHVLDADIKGFFNNIPHHVIMNGVSDLVADGNILYLIEQFLRAGVIEDGIFTPTDVGTPQGGVITPPTILRNRSFWRQLLSGRNSGRGTDKFGRPVGCNGEPRGERDRVGGLRN